MSSESSQATPRSRRGSWIAFAFVVSVFASAAWGNSDRLKAGETVVAIGSPRASSPTPSPSA